MGENPIRAARSKRESSMHLAYTEVVEGRGIATISAGNSGAFMATGILIAKRTPGCDRPSIAACVPTGDHITILTDVGANVECRAAHLVQFAIMGATYHAIKFNGDRPTVGLLANGKESSKGTDVLREAHRLLNQTDLNYLGYVESRDFPEGCADVVVTDGLVGNIVLKLCEGMVTAVFGRIRQAVQSHWLSALVAPALKAPFSKLSSELNWENVGGAPLLGLSQTAIVAHGNASPLAIANCVARAREYAELGLHDAIHTALKDQAPGEQVSTAELPVGRSTGEHESKN